MNYQFFVTSQNPISFKYIQVSQNPWFEPTQINFTFQLQNIKTLYLKDESCAQILTELLKYKFNKSLHCLLSLFSIIFLKL